MGNLFSALKYLSMHVQYGFFLENACIVRKLLLKLSFKISWSLMNDPAYR